MKKASMSVLILLLQILFYCCSLADGTSPTIPPPPPEAPQPPPDETGKLTAADAEAHDYFGSSVAADGDTVLVGAYEENGKGSRRGAAYLFYRNQGGENNWGEVIKLTAFDKANDDYFVNSAGISGNRIIIGAERKCGPNNFQGAAYLFSVV